MRQCRSELLLEPLPKGEYAVHELVLADSDVFAAGGVLLRTTSVNSGSRK